MKSFGLIMIALLVASVATAAQPAAGDWNAVIKVGEKAYVLALMLLNPFQALPGGTNAGDVLSNFALPYEIQYQAGNLTNWTLGQPDMQAVHAGNLVPGQYFYVDVLAFTGSQPGLYEMNISARLLGAAPPDVSAPQFGAFATTVFSLDAPGLVVVELNFDDELGPNQVSVVGVGRIDERAHLLDRGESTCRYKNVNGRHHLPITVSEFPIDERYCC